MYCKNCGNQMDDLAAICVKCGVAKGNGFKYCNNCGSEVNQQANFCLSCGNQLKNTYVNNNIANIQSDINNTINRIATPDGYAIVGFILGIVSVIGSFSSLIAALVCSVAAIILGKNALKEKTKNDGMAKAGIVLGIVALAIRVVTLVLFILTVLGISLSIK